MHQPQLSAQSRTEYDFREEHFKYIRELVLESSGIVLSDIKRDMVYGRLVRRLRALNIKTFSEYLKIIKNGDSEELEEFTNSITTNLTSFFREKHHFEFIKNKVIPELISARQRKIRFWSAGCSTGEEPYSLAITLADQLPRLMGADVKILATDLDSQVVATAREGIYSRDRIQGLPKAICSKWFTSSLGNNKETVQVASKLQGLITFNQLNLMHKWPMKGSFDVIFCRNVVIYFNKDTQKILFDRYANYLNTGGYLIVGHSESLHGVTSRFKLLGNTIYQKID